MFNYNSYNYHLDQLNNITDHVLLWTYSMNNCVILISTAPIRIR